MDTISMHDTIGHDDHHPVRGSRGYGYPYDQRAGAVRWATGAVAAAAVDRAPGVL